MKKKIVLVAVVFIFSLASFGMYMYVKPHKQVRDIESKLDTTALSLIKKSNQEPETFLGLLDSAIEVSGEVTTVEKGAENTIVILNDGVKCELANYDAKSIAPGEKVKIKGIYSGFDELFNEISFTRCYVMN